MLNGAVSVIFEGTPFHPSNERFWQVKQIVLMKFFHNVTNIHFCF